MELQDPQTGDSGSSLEHMHQAARSFYGQLYSKEPIQDTAVRDLLDHIPPSRCLPPSDRQFLVQEFTIEELQQAVSRAPKQSSPGMDGLPYAILALVFRHEMYHGLILRVYNDALRHAVFPTS